MGYNLLGEPWIPVLYSDGRYERVGIVRALQDAGRIREIAASNPMDRVAVLRFLIAVLLWCKEDAKTALAALSEGSIGVPRVWLGKLTDHKTAFNLLGDEARFYQDASLKGSEPRPIADLLVEFPGADSVNHMRHIVHGSYGFCPACCTMGILRLSVWAPANRYYPASVNPGSAAYAITECRSLLLTLGANLPEATGQASQAPWLADAPPDSPDAVAHLAWRPRKLWLNTAGEQGSCASCGVSGVLVESLSNEGGWPTPTTDGQKFAKAVEAEFKALGYNTKGKDEANKTVKKAVKNAALIRACRMDRLREACNASSPPCATGAPSPETDEHAIARVFHALISSGDTKAIKALTGNANGAEQSQLSEGDTKTKKFWVADPHLLREGEAISLPGLGADVAAHASRFWRDALRLRGERTGKVVAIGPVVNKFTFQDATSVPVPHTATMERAELTKACAEILRGTEGKEGPNEDDEAKLRRRGVLRTVTPNPDRGHPEIRAALVLLTPDAEGRVRDQVGASDPAKDDAQFLRGVFEPLVDHVVASTARGSPLSRRAASTHARALLSERIRKLGETTPRTPSTAAAGPAGKSGSSGHIREVQA